MVFNKEEKLIGDAKLSFKEIMKRNWRYVKPEASHLFIAGFLIILTVVLDLCLPLLIGVITNLLIAQGTIDITKILLIVGGYFIISLFSLSLMYIQSMMLQHIGQRIVYNLRMEIFTHIENMSQNQHDLMPVGSLVTRVCNYTASMSDLFTNVIVNVIRNILSVIGVYIIMIIKSPTLSLILFGFVIVIFVGSMIFRQIVSKIFRKERKCVSDLNTFLNENLSGMKLIQIFNQQKSKEMEFLKKNEDLRKARFNITIAYGIYRPFINFLYVLAQATIFYVGIKLALDGGTVVVFYMYLSKFFNPIENLADQLNNIQKAFSASEKLFNLLDVEPEIMDSEEAIDIDHFEGKIEFKNVWFAYNAENWILKDVSFVINPKETCAFVGATGAGKTTILALIVRNYEIQKGQILIDDIDISKIKIESLRKAIGQMLQDVFLFSGNIRSNITLHDDSFSDEEVLDTCKYVNADKILEKTEHGLDEEVVERGENFSQGQRQLLSFARTVLHKPQILILDEATANIDTETEVLIQNSLEKIKNIGTMLVVAHRLSTIQHADQIIVLQNGEIIERGKHQELLKKKGYYHKLYQLQFEKRD